MVSKQGQIDYTLDDVFDMLDTFEESVDEIVSEDEMEELEEYLNSRWNAGFMKAVKWRKWRIRK